jgi:hypothetical protein|tara:strand:+ start:2442 stop:2918 length:477 start_codon:yes stop_codon:yes gene_type:complete
MNKKFEIILIFSFVFILNGCGYNKLNNTKNNTIHISEITLLGEQRIGYIIKNELLLSSSPNGENNLKLKLDIDKQKFIKEKSIRDKVTRYKNTITVELLIIEVSTNKEIKKKFTKDTNYEAYDSKSRTMSSERRSIENTAELLSDNIKDFINLNYKTK